MRTLFGRGSDILIDMTTYRSIRVCARCCHPVTMHVRSGCRAFDDRRDDRCACIASHEARAQPLPEPVRAAVGCKA